MKLVFNAYNGLNYTVEDGMDKEEARKEAAAYIRRARAKTHDVQTLTTGVGWEIQSQANINGFAVTDDDGTLYLLTELRDVRENDEPDEEFDHTFICSNCGDVAFNDEGDGDECDECIALETSGEHDHAA